MELIHTLLLQAIEGESGAEARYEKFAAKAKEEGFAGMAALFTALSRAEAVHIANHKRALLKNGCQSALLEIPEGDGVGSTLENIDGAIRAEYEEFHAMYPSFRRQIQKKHGTVFSAKIALLSIKWACESESNHHALLKEARKRVAAGRDMTEGHFYLCSVCGNLHYLEEMPKELCCVCGHDLSFYTVIRVEQ
jgi:rubrerythrin